MKYKWLTLILIVLLTTACSAAFAENTAGEGLAFEEEWAWENEAVNSFSGTMDLSGYIGQEIQLQIKASFEPDNDSDEYPLPKFTSVEGKRIAMLQQSDSVSFTPGDEDSEFNFIASLMMPEKGHFQKIQIQVTATDGEGNEIKHISSAVSVKGSGTSASGRVFYIPFNIRTVTIVLFAAAALVWIAALVRNRQLRKK